MNEIYRQGDVLFKKLARAPRGERKVRPTGHILEGEATGHIHRIADLDSATVFEIEDGLFLKAVQVECPSTGRLYFLRVPPSIERADDAVAWTFGFDTAKKYQPTAES